MSNYTSYIMLQNITQSSLRATESIVAWLEKPARCYPVLVSGIQKITKNTNLLVFLTGPRGQATG